MTELPVVSLLRDEGGPSFPDGTFGILLVDSHPPLQSMEDDWRENLKGQSCIPEGDYLLRRSWFHRHGYEVFEVTQVPGRDRILIHPGNTEEDVEGCIAPGLRRGSLRRHDEDVRCPYRKRPDSCPIQSHWRDKRGVLESREGFRMFMAWMGGIDDALLRVRWAPGLPR